MFKTLRSSNLNIDHVFAVTIGKPGKQTLARWHLAEPKDVISAIVMLNESTMEASMPGKDASALNFG